MSDFIPWLLVGFGVFVILFAIVNEFFTLGEISSIHKAIIGAGLFASLIGASLLAHSLVVFIVLFTILFLLYWLGWRSLSKGCRIIFSGICRIMWLMWARRSAPRKNSNFD